MQPLLASRSYVLCVLKSHCLSQIEKLHNGICTGSVHTRYDQAYVTHILNSI